MITQDRLKELLSYCPETGEFRYLADGNNQYTKAGALAGSINGHGRRYIKIDGVQYSSHRLAWLYVNGLFPDKDIDHIDCDPLNNRIENLRLCNDSENQANRGARKNNKVGLKGVNWCNTRKKYVAQIQKNGKGKTIGRYDCKAAAHFAYLVESDKIHGEYSWKGAK
jgi:hypothetical protein